MFRNAAEKLEELYVFEFIVVIFVCYFIWNRHLRAGKDDSRLFNADVEQSVHDVVCSNLEGHRFLFSVLVIIIYRSKSVGIDFKQFVDLSCVDVLLSE